MALPPSPAASLSPSVRFREAPEPSLADEGAHKATAAGRGEPAPFAAPSKALWKRYTPGLLLVLAGVLLMLRGMICQETWHQVAEDAEDGIKGASRHSRRKRQTHAYESKPLPASDPDQGRRGRSNREDDDDDDVIDV